MPYILVYLDTPVLSIPAPPDELARPGDRHEHVGRREYFGTEDAALRRAADLLPAPAWRDLRLYGPDGAKLAGQTELDRRLKAARDGVAGIGS